MIRGYVILRFHLSSLRHDTTSIFEFTRIAKQCFHTLLSRMLRCDHMQSLSSRFEFKKVAISTASRVVSPFVSSLSFSLSKSQKTSCWVSLEDICERHLFSIFLSFWSKIHNHTAWRSHQGSGAHKGQDDTVAALALPESFGPSTLLDLSKVSPLQPALLRQRQLFSFATSSRVSSSAFSPPPASCSLVSCSLPVQLYSHICSHSCDWLVSHGLSPVTFTQWCFGCSSGKRVSMFVLFCYYPH